MYTLPEQVIKKYFPNESITHSYIGNLNKEVEKVQGIPFSAFSSLGVPLYSDIHIDETNNYWFVDLRYKVKWFNRLISLLSILVFLFFVSQLSLNIPPAFLVLIVFIFITYSVVDLLFMYNGLFIHAYPKNWITSEISDNKLKLLVNMPKYSKDSVWKLKYGNKILDFIGITVSSAPGQTDYSFDIK